MCGDRRDMPEGARRVGAFDRCCDTERLFIWMLRRWLDSVCGQQAVWNALAATAGRQSGHAALALFEAYLVAIAKHVRRQIYRHSTACDCVGADERAMAQLVCKAGSGDLDEAYSLAGQLVLEAGLFETVETAAQLGRVLNPISAHVLQEIEPTLIAERASTAIDRPHVSNWGLH